MVQPLWKAVQWFHTKLNILSPYNPANALFSIYPNELKTHVHIKLCTGMFIVVVVVIIGRNWQQPRCISVGHRIK